MRDVRFAGGVRVCAGQSEFSAGGCRDLMVEGAIDVCNFDSSWSGGPTEWRRVAAAAVSFDVAMAHHEEPQIATHLLASIPHGTFLEVFSADARPDLVEPRRQPACHRRRAHGPARAHRVSAGSSTATTSRRTGSRLARDGAGVAATTRRGTRGERRPRHRRGRRDRRRRSRTPSPRPGPAWRRSTGEEAEARALAASLPGEGHVGIGADLADVARARRRGRGRRGRGRPARRARRISRRSCGAGGRPRRRRARLGRADGRQPEGDVLPRPRLRRAAPRHGAAGRDRQLQLTGLVDGRASAAPSSTTRRRAGSSR